MIINLQDITNDHPVWRDWRIVDNFIQWHDGSVRLHGNTLASYEWSMNMTSGLIGEVSRIQESPLKLTDIDRQRMINVHNSLKHIGDALKELEVDLDIVGLGYGRPDEVVKIHADRSCILKARKVNKFGGNC